MSSKWSSSRLSQSSSSESDMETQTSKPGHKSADSSDASGDEGSRNRKSRSDSGSDSGTARSKSSSNSRSRSRSGSAKSGSANRGGNSSDSGTGGSRHSSPEKGSGRNRSSSSSGSSSGSGSPAAKRRRQGSAQGSDGSRAGSPASPRGQEKSRDKIYSSSDSSSQASTSSSTSNKEKKFKKSKDHKPSSQLEKQLARADSEDEDENAGRKKSKKKSQKTQEQSSEEENWRDEFDDGLDEEFIGGEEDRIRLESMTEREREEEFYRRAEKREELKKRFEISQKLKKQQKQKSGDLSSDGEIRDDDASTVRSEAGGESSGSKTSSLADKFPSDPMSRKKGYEEKYGSKFSALSELKAKREEKERKEKMREEKMKKTKKDVSDSDSGGSDYEKLGRNKKKGNVLKASEIYSSSSSDEGGDVRRKTSSSSSSSSSESDGESDTERQGSKKTVKKAMNIETIEQLEKIRLSRFKLDKFVHLPIFKKTVIGCFVRVGIGKSPDGRDVYRCCEIVDTCETAKVYNVMKTKTNLGLKLRHGKDTRVFRIQFVSNNPLSESEFEKYKKACTDGNTSLPTISHVEQKQKDIKYALEYRFSTADVEKILASKKKFDSTPKNYAMQKAEFTKMRDMASFTGDLDKVDEYNKELEKLERRAEELDSQRTSTISSISFINDRNRKNNISRAYQGIRQEEKRKQIEGEVDDPFTRRKTKPKLGNTKQKQPEQEMTSELLKKLEDERKAAEAAKKAVKVDINPILPPPIDFSVKTGKKSHFGKPNVDIFDAHDFEVDINVDEIQTAPVTPSISLKPVTTSSAPAGPVKRSLKLEEWKKKRGIM